MKIESVSFERAKPVWAKGRETEKNLTLSFFVTLSKADKALLRLAGATVYQVFVNGGFCAAGPARAAHDYYRVDELELGLEREDNFIEIRVAGYNANSYYVLDQPSFLCAEIVADGVIVAATGENFSAVEYTERLQRVQRYSFQRPFVEVYRLDQEHRERPLLSLEETESKQFLPRGVAYPKYEQERPRRTIAGGHVTRSEKESYYRDRSMTDIGEQLKGYRLDELDIISTQEAEKIDFTERWNGERDADVVSLKKDSYVLYDMQKNYTGLLGFEIECREDTTLYLLFDEILSDGRVDFLRLGCANVLVWQLKKGRYSCLSFEPYTLRYLQAVSLGGDCEIQDIHIRRVGFSKVTRQIDTEREDCKAIYDAAVETFRQNTLDIYMDCPSRERAGWLCDSFFTSRVEYILTGQSHVERNFLENFLLPERFPHLPEGMLPMCYPADHDNGVFIPNWAMWFVLELEEYLQRTGDRQLIDAARERVYGLVSYFGRFKNEFGLLERLESWVFVEWSKSNELIQDVNFPTNMLYVRMLRTVASLYGDAALEEQADRLAEEIRRLSFTGTFFCDNALRREEGLVLSGECTETCQYYAFYMGIVTPESHPDLWNILQTDFGAQRKQTGKWPEVHFANMFVGNYLRLELLARYGEGEQTLQEIEEYFHEMPIRTGTLWEHDGPYASCSHGFASHVIYYFEQLGMLR